MAEHRSSISSNGPAFLSMALQQLNDLDECPPLSTISTYKKEENLISSTSDSRPMLMKSSSSAKGSDPAISASAGNQPGTVTSTTSPFSSSLYLDNSTDGFSIGNHNETITLDMIQTLPLFDAAASSSNRDVYSNSLRCYISNMIMPTANCKSSCTIRDASSLSTVLQKIHDFLRIQCIAYSIQYTPTTVAFHCERNSAFASLVGPSLVFVIYLWYEQEAPQLKNDSVDIAGPISSESKPILVDIQRRRGCPLDLQCLRRSLFRSLLNTECAKEVGTRQGMIPLDICRSVTKDIDDATTSNSTVSEEDLETNKEQASSEAVELLLHYQTMLELTNTVENHRMGLECLCQNTDSTVTDVNKSKPVVQAIIVGPTKNSHEGTDDTNNVIIEKLRASLLHFVTLSDTPEVTPILATAGCSPKNLQCLAFRALFTSLNAYVATTTESNTVVSIENDPFWYQVIQTCRRGIVTSNTAPCFATVSIMLICTLLSATFVSEAGKEMIYAILCPENDSSSICDDLKNAQAWGQKHHTHLEATSQQLLGLLVSKYGVRL
jgi:hypothetical protein